VTTINLDPPAEGERLVRLLNSGRSDELNIAGVSYKPDKRGAFYVPQKHVTRELLTVASFYPATITVAESLQDVATHVNLMAPSVAKTKLSQALADLCEAVD
jgi:hypothetical protein